MRTILKISGQYALLLWAGNHQPYVTVLLEESGYKVGDQIQVNSLYPCNCFSDLRAALDDLTKRSGE